LLVVLALDFSWASLPFRSYGLSLDDDADEEETVFDYNKFLRDPMKVPKPNAKVKIETLGSMLKGKRPHILVLFCTRKIKTFCIATTNTFYITIIDYRMILIMTCFFKFYANKYFVYMARTFLYLYTSRPDQWQICSTI